MDDKKPSTSAPVTFNRVLGRGDLMATAVGLIIGAGIITLTGTAIGMTGRSVSIAFILAMLITVVSNYPFAYVSGTVRLEGGQYSQMVLFAPRLITGIYIWVNVFAVFSLAMYGISFGEYLLDTVPLGGLNVRIAALIVITVTFILNFLGIKNAVKVQIAMVLIMLVALTLYAAFGLPKVDYAGYLEPEQFLPGGAVGLLTATALLTFATDGAKQIVNLSPECKNPTEDIPRVMRTSTLLVGGLYMLIGVTASGVLPVEIVANRPLSVVAREILPYPVYVFFVLGGALFALMTTINGTVGYMTKPMIQACQDGWMPKKLGTLNARFKTPHWLLIIFYFVSITPIVLNLDINTIANSAIILLRIGVMLLSLYTMRLPGMLPEAWAKSPQHVSNARMKTMCIFAGILALFQVVMLAIDCSVPALIANAALLVLAVILALVCHRKVNLTVNYEEYK